MSYTTAEPHTGNRILLSQYLVHEILFRPKIMTDGFSILGYYLLKEWAASKPLGGFSFTSNIDGHWLRCGFPGKSRIQEV